MGSHYGGHRELHIKEGSEDGEALVLDLGYALGMELDIDLKECYMDSPISGKSAPSLGGVEAQDTVGSANHNGANDDVHSRNGAKSNTKEVLGGDAGNCNSSDGEEDSAAAIALAEMKA